MIICKRCNGNGTINGKTDIDAHGKFWTADPCDKCGGIGYLTTKDRINMAKDKIDELIAELKGKLIN